MSLAWPVTRIAGQPSFILETDRVHAALTRTGGMLGPVRFAFSDRTITPYAVAPWAEETVEPGTPAMLRTLRGDWFCSAFGEGDPSLPPHGETAHRDWSFEAGGRDERGCWLGLATELPLQGGRCTSLTALLEGETMIYQTHRLEQQRRATSVGHHAMLAFPRRDGSGRLSFSRTILARTSVAPLEAPERGGRSALAPNQMIEQITAAPMADGSTTDLSRFPARAGCDDLAILCADPSLPFAWSAVTFADDRYVWFALRDPRVLASTMLWFSNGGRPYPPWNGRHRAVMGIEDITGYFHLGPEPSRRPNPITAAGIPTALAPDCDGAIVVRYIQGVAMVSEGFGELAAIEAAGDDRISLVGSSGAEVFASCQLAFLQSGNLPWNGGLQ